MYPMILANYGQYSMITQFFVSGTEMFEDQACFGAAGIACDAVRRNIPATEGTKSLIQKRHVVSKPDQRSFCNFANHSFSSRRPFFSLGLASNGQSEGLE